MRLDVFVGVEVVNGRWALRVAGSFGITRRKYEKRS